ncbi:MULTISPECIES: IS200/IS605 family element RNA-guided endonuclease TnpB [unclassified Methanoculleus]|uniref:IS200/IS605 family element RNA-guided endonuclease TnpB n=1 Tax=unclassified Methanoculleus TaxID=2619537 RepID=UPI0025D48ADD|nr:MULTISPECIES: IS200/IS605 family element RNA-guided endonuclease TnpB [unclassified Methanoculleus]
MLRRYQYRIYPTRAQEILIAKHLGCCRYVYNWALDRKNQAYHANGISLSGYDLIKELVPLKTEHPWLKEVNAQSLQQSIIHLARAFTNFFAGRAEEPTFKKKHAPEQTFTVPQSYTVDFKQGTVKLPKIGGIKVKYHRTFVGTMKSATVIRRSTGRYFISIVVEDGKKAPKPADPIPNQTVGIDLGLMHYAILSTGDAVANPKYLQNTQQRLAVLQRRLGRKQKGSKNRNKARFKVARCHQKIADQRWDFQHQLSSRLVRENQALAVESLNVGGMVKNHKLARAISDAGWGSFVSMLTYKCQEAGKPLLQVGMFNASSKTCSVCGYRKTDLTLKDREWTCPECGTHHDRDINAAINIKQFALAGAGRAEEPVDSLPVGRGMKQEAPCTSGG